MLLGHQDDVPANADGSGGARAGHHAQEQSGDRRSPAEALLLIQARCAEAEVHCTAGGASTIPSSESHSSS